MLQLCACYFVFAPLACFLSLLLPGTSPIEVFWVHNNNDIPPKDPIFEQVMYTENDGLSYIHKLLISEVLPEDAGEYVCEAYNQYGDTDTFCRLSITGRKMWKEFLYIGGGKYIR